VEQKETNSQRNVDRHSAVFLSADLHSSYCHSAHCHYEIGILLNVILMRVAWCNVILLILQVPNVILLAVILLSVFC
jgi:hypothetical protein